MTWRRAFPLAIVLAAIACPAAAYKPYRPRIVSLTPELVRKVIACHPGVTRASRRPVPAGLDRREARRRQFQPIYAALERCGLPSYAQWRDAQASVVQARAAPDEDAALAGSDAATNAANRAVVAPFKAQLDRLFAGAE